MVRDRQCGDRRGSTLRFSADVFPERSGSRPGRPRLRMEYQPGVHGAFRRDRRPVERAPRVREARSRSDGSGRRTAVPLPCLARGLVPRGSRGRAPPPSSECDGGRVRTRLDAASEQARRPSGRPWVQPEGARGGQRVTLLLLHSLGGTGVSPYPWSDDGGLGTGLDGPGVGDFSVVGRSRRLGLVRATPHGRPRDHVLSPEGRGRQAERVRRRAPHRHRWHHTHARPRSARPGGVGSLGESSRRGRIPFGLARHGSG